MRKMLCSMPLCQWLILCFCLSVIAPPAMAEPRPQKPPPAGLPKLKTDLAAVDIQFKVLRKTATSVSVRITGLVKNLGRLPYVHNFSVVLTDDPRGRGSMVTKQFMRLDGGKMVKVVVDRKYPRKALTKKPIPITLFVSHDPDYFSNPDTNRKNDTRKELLDLRKIK